MHKCMKTIDQSYAIALTYKYRRTFEMSRSQRTIMCASNSFETAHTTNSYVAIFLVQSTMECLVVDNEAHASAAIHKFVRPLSIFETISIYVYITCELIFINNTCDDTFM